jgi:hypothetical protein
LKLEADKKILAGGLPAADRAIVGILEASSNDEVDQILRDIPAWGVLKWKVTPFQSFEGRANKERSIVERSRKTSHERPANAESFVSAKPGVLPAKKMLCRMKTCQWSPRQVRGYRPTRRLRAG